MLPPPFESVLLPTDLETGSERAFHHALVLALAAKGQLRILHVHGGADRKEFPHVRETLKKWGRIDDVDDNEALAKVGVYVTRLETDPGDPVQRIVHDVETHTPDLLVMATRGRDGLLRFLSRAVAEPVLRQAHVPTLLLGPSATPFVNEWGEVAFERVLVPVAPRPDPQLALEGAVRLIRTMGMPEGRVRVIHVGTEMPELRLPTIEGWTVETALLEGDPLEQILLDAAATSEHCIVMSSLGHDSAGDAVFGSTAERIAREAGCPVLVMPTTR